VESAVDCAKLGEKCSCRNYHFQFSCLETIKNEKKQTAEQFAPKKAKPG